jgi:hypothetical protein
MDRQAGKSKISLREIWGGIWTVVRLVFTPAGRKTAGDRLPGRASAATMA